MWTPVKWIFGCCLRSNPFPVQIKVNLNCDPCDITGTYKLFVWCCIAGEKGDCQRFNWNEGRCECKPLLLRTYYNNIFSAFKLGKVGIRIRAGLNDTSENFRLEAYNTDLFMYFFSCVALLISAETLNRFLVGYVNTGQSASCRCSGWPWPSGTAFHQERCKSRCTWSGGTYYSICSFCWGVTIFYFWRVIWG